MCLILQVAFWFVYIRFGGIVKFQFLTLLITFPAQSCLILYSFWVSLQHSLIMWLIVSSLSLQNQHLLFFGKLSILALIYWILIRLFCAAIIIIIIIIIHKSFSHQRHLMVFHWSLSDSKSPQVSRTHLRMLAVFSNAVVWIVSTRPPTSKSSRPFNNPLVSAPNAPVTTGTIVTFVARSRYLSFFSLSFRFILWSAGTAKSTILQILYFCWLLWGLVFWPGLGDPFVN